MLMNNTGAGGVTGGGMQNFEQFNFDPNKQMTPEQMQKMQMEMMRQMQMMQNNLMRMQGNNVMEQNGITVNGDAIPKTAEATMGAAGQAPEEPSLSELRANVNNGETSTSAEADENIDIDAPVTESPIAKELEQFSKADKEQKSNAPEEKNELEAAVDEIAKKSHLKPETENYGFVKRVMSRINAQKPGESLEFLDRARKVYLKNLYPEEEKTEDISKIL